MYNSFKVCCAEDLAPAEILLLYVATCLSQVVQLRGKQLESTGDSQATWV